MSPSERIPTDRTDDLTIECRYEPDPEAIARAVAILLRGIPPRDVRPADEASDIARTKDAPFRRAKRSG